MIRPIGNATKQRLRTAIERMLAGQPLATDGRLTIVNLAIEAGEAAPQQIEPARY